MYKVIWHQKALDESSKLSEALEKEIKNKVETYLIQAPADLGKRLAIPFKGLYGYRYGNYRVIYKISRSTQTIYIVRVDHRSEIYEN